MAIAKMGTSMLAAALALGLCGVANAKGTKHHAGVHGVIESVSGNQITVKIGSKKAGNQQEVTLNVANVTVELKKHAAGSTADLKPQDHILIEPDTTNPTKIVDLGHGRGKHHKAA